MKARLARLCTLSFVALLIGAWAVVGLSTGSGAVPLSETFIHGYDTPITTYDAAVNTVQIPTGEAGLVAVDVGTTAAQESALPASGTFSIAKWLAVAANSAGGYSSFGRAKTALGAADEGNVYDHVVEQSQIVRSAFAPEQIHNPANFNQVPSWVNQLNANYYSTKPHWADGGTVRDRLSGQSFADQHALGMQVTQDIFNGVIGGAA